VYTAPSKAKGPPKNYAVPNFGVDEDIAWTQKNIASASKKLKHDWKPVQDENGVWAVPEAAAAGSYTYDSLVQTDAQSDPTCSSAFDCVTPAHATHKMNYFVPNFGEDRNVASTQESINWAENNLKHRWVVTPEQLKKQKQVLYDTEENRGLDGDIKASLQNLSEQEKVHGKWNLPEEEDVQI
jgi:hypothetical protein